MGIARLFTQPVTVKPYLGVKNGQPSYGNPAEVLCFVNDGHERTATQNGVEIVSQTTIYAPLSSIDSFAPGSQVTFNDRTAHVVSVFRRDSAGPVSAHHAQVNIV